MLIFIETLTSFIESMWVKVIDSSFALYWNEQLLSYSSHWLKISSSSYKPKKDSYILRI